MLTDERLARGRGIEAVAVGASAGAVEALGTLLPALPATLRAAVIVVVHVPSNRPSLLVELFAPKCALPVHEAEDKCAVRPGTIWFAPPGYHLLIERDRTFALSVDEPVNFSRPSIDVLFEAAADVYQEQLLGVILSGANHDGALGAATIQRRGGLLAVQTPDTAKAATMPAICIERTQPDLVGSLEELAGFIVRHALREQP